MTLVLRQLCGSRGILPASLTLSGSVKTTNDRPQASGGFAEVWVGRHRGHKVAIKALRIYANDDMAKVKKVSSTCAHLYCTHETDLISDFVEKQLSGDVSAILDLCPSWA